MNLLLGTAAICIIGYFFYLQDLAGVYTGLGVVGAWLMSVFIFVMRGPKLSCSLCMSPIWGGKKCQKHKKVKPALGISYRLGVATGVLFRGWYRCPYCGEPFSARKTRERGGQNY